MVTSYQDREITHLSSPKPPLCMATSSDTWGGSGSPVFKYVRLLSKLAPDFSSSHLQDTVCYI
jgi:hypothetical protein